MSNTQFILWLMVLTGLLPLPFVLHGIFRRKTWGTWTRALPRLLIMSILTGLLGLGLHETSRDPALALLGAMGALWLSSGVRTVLRFFQVWKTGGSFFLAAAATPILTLTCIGLTLSYAALPRRTEAGPGTTVMPTPSPGLIGRGFTGERYLSYRDPVLGYTLQPGYAWFKDPVTDIALSKIETAAVWQDVGLVGSSVVFPESCPPDDQILRVLLFNEDLAYPNDSLRKTDETTRGDFRHLVYRSRQVGEEGPITNLHHVFVGENVAACITVYADEGVEQLNGVSSRMASMFTPGPARIPVNPEAWSEEYRQNQALRLNQVALDHYENQQNEASLTWCAAALEQVENPPPVLLSNALLILNEMERHTDALAWLKRHAADLDHLPEDHESWYAWHLFHAGERDEGLRRYETLFQEGFRNNEELVAYMTLILEQDPQPDRAQGVLRNYASTSGRRTLLLEAARRFRNAGHPQAALDELKRLEASDPTLHPDPTLVLEKLYALNDIGRFTDALALADHLETAGHLDANLLYHRAQSLYGLKRYPEAKQVLEQGLTLSPGNTLILDDLRMVAGMMGQGENSSVRMPIDPLPVPEDLPVHPETPGAEPPFAPGGEILVDLQLLKKTAPTVLTRTVMQRIHVTDRSAANTFRTLTLDFSPLSERVYVNRLRVYHPDGSLKAEADRETFYIQDDEDRTLATFDKTLQIPVPQLAPGCTIEFVHTRETTVEADSIPFEVRYFAKFNPVRVSAQVWLGDTGSLYHTRFHLDPPLKLKDGLAWIVRDIPAYRWEHLQAEATRFVNTLVLGDADATWEEEAKTYCERIAPSLKSSPGIYDKVQALIEGVASPRERIRILANYVQRNCQYQGIEFGVRGRLPNQPDEILARNFGDCKDHTVLLVQFLREAGIEAHPALVNTDSRVHREIASLDQFDHMIVYAKLEGGDLFVDATDKHSNLLEQPPVAHGSPTALVLDPASPRLVRIPRIETEQNQVKVDTRISSNDGRLRFEETSTHTGLDASRFRSWLHSVNPADRSQQFHDYIITNPQAVRNLEVEVKHLDDPEQPVELILSYERELPPPGQSLPASLWDAFFLRPTVVADRRTPFENKNPFRYHRKVTWGEPVPLEGNPVQSLNESRSTESWTLEPGTRTSTLTMRVPRFVSPPEAYEAFQQGREEILKSTKLSVRKSSPSP